MALVAIIEIWSPSLSFLLTITDEIVNGNHCCKGKSCKNIAHPALAARDAEKRLRTLLAM